MSHDGGRGQQISVPFQVYRKLHVRTVKTLTCAEDPDEFDEDEERKIAGSDWMEDCKRYGLPPNGSLTMVQFFDSMYQLVDLWAADLQVSFLTKNGGDY